MSVPPSMSNVVIGVVPAVSPAPDPVKDAADATPVTVTLVVPVGTFRATASASFFSVMSFELPCPVIIIPSALVYPTAAVSPVLVSAVRSTVWEMKK